MAVVGIWMIAIGCGTPTALYNRTVSSSNITNTYCVSMFPTQNSFVIFKYFEFAFYYFIPVCVQIVLYSIISKRLYVSTDELHTKFQMRTEPNSRKTDRAAETIKARKGVVKMLVASVVVYTLCYAPPQILLFYNTLSKTMFHETWSFQVFVTVIAYINSAANPVLYSIFSQNFRRNFKRCLFCMCLTNSKEPYMRARFTDSFESRGISRKVSTTRTTISRL